MILFRVWLNTSWFGIHNKVLNFHNWTLCYHKPFHDKIKKYKSMGLSMGLWHSNNMKSILRKFAKYHCFWTLWTLNYVDCISFSCIDSFHMVEPLSLQKGSYKNGPVHLSIYLSVYASVLHFSQDLLCGFFWFVNFLKLLKSSKAWFWKIDFIWTNLDQKQDIWHFNQGNITFCALADFP